MSISEFKAWFEGFTENIGDKLPTKKQWARIQERVSEINETITISNPIVIHERQPWWPSPYTPIWSTNISDPNIQNGTFTCSVEDHAKEIGKLEAKGF